MRSLVLILALVCAASAYTAWNELEAYTFEDFVVEFDKHYSLAEYEMRRTIFNTKLASIRAHNKDTTQTWREGVNKYTDATTEEFKALRGYNPSARPSAEARTLFHTAPKALNKVDVSGLPTQVDWREKNVVTAPKDQASCGSCWSFATAETLESHWAIKTGKLTVLSEQQILDCTPNPNHCGGSGGCNGGTAELAYARIAALGGLTSESLYPYVSGAGQDYQCKKPIPAPVAKVTNYTKLPENQYEPLLEAVATVGPIAISVDASSWGAYAGGVFNGCNQKNPDIDHAVVLVGYGTDPKLGDYWLVRNSWGASWGEKGYIRLARTASNSTCGVDTTPADGSGCDGGPPTVTVCGTCGILYDTCYPLV